MISKEQIAHELTIIYLTNKYGIDVRGDINIMTIDRDVTGGGIIETVKMPDLDEIKIRKVKTSEKNIFGFAKSTNINDGYEVDTIFKNMVSDYTQAYQRVLIILTDSSGF